MESSLAVEEAILLLFEEVTVALPEEMVMSPPEVVPLKDTLDSSQERSPPFIFASRLVIRLRFHLAPENEMQSVTCNKKYTTNPQNSMIFQLIQLFG